MTELVVDVGSADHHDVVGDGSPGDPGQLSTHSIRSLVARYLPDRLVGFDPLAAEVPQYDLYGTKCEHVCAAAWTYDGQLDFLDMGVSSRPLVAPSAWIANADRMVVSCVDLARWLSEREEGNIILKIDAEYSEYMLIPHLHERGVDERLALLLLEQHGERDPYLLDGWRCPVREWWM